MSSTQVPLPTPASQFLCFSSFAELLDLERAKNALLCMQLMEERNRTMQLMTQIAVRECQAQPVTPLLSEHDHQVGAYSRAVRQLKIARYKAKMKGRMLRARETRGSKGRSIVAQTKPRVKGRFVKTQ